jgi:hypothetical protein
LTVAPMTPSPKPFSTGIGSPVIIDSSMLLFAIDNHSIYRDFFTRTHAKCVAFLDLIDSNLFFCSVLNAMGRFRS